MTGAHTRYLTLLMTIAAIGLSTAATYGQSRKPHAPPKQERPVMIHDVTIHTVTGGVIERGHVVMQDGVITAVGEGRPRMPANAEHIDGRGLHVYPGLIALDTTLGLTEVSGVGVTVDHTERGRVNPEVRAAVAVNPDSDLITVSRAHGGILTALVAPRGGLISGRGSTMRLDGWTWEMMAINADTGLFINWPRTEPITAWWMDTSEDEQRKQIAVDLENIEKFFDDAEAYFRAKDANETVKTDLRFEGLRRAIAGEQPIYVRASSRGQIESAVGWAHRRDFDLILVGGDDADQVLPLLKQHDVRVIVNGTHRLPSQRHHDYDQPFTLPAKLHQAGVRFAIAGGTSPAHLRQLGHIAATAAAYGLPKEEAIKSVTIHAAKMIGLGGSHGAIEPGKAATLILTTGDPLEITSDVVKAFIDGREIDLGNRQNSLYEKFREKYRQINDQ